MTALLGDVLAALAFIAIGAAGAWLYLDTVRHEYVKQGWREALAWTSDALTEVRKLAALAHQWNDRVVDSLLDELFDDPTDPNVRIVE